MQKNKTLYFLVLFCIIGLQLRMASAQIGDAGQPGEFLRYGVGARALGMGNAFTGLANDASAIYWNPAGLMNMQQKELASMYTNLFYDSRYTFTAIALPRTLKLRGRVGSFFLGPNSAVGFGWVKLNMAEFDERTTNNISRGTFNIYEQAAILSWAHEYVNTWGVLNYGVNLKWFDQGFPGYSGQDVGSAFSTDFGATFRPINAPLFKIISLRYLMPLQFGVSLQNIGQWNIGSGISMDRFPFVVRWGASYQISFLDWRINIVLDQEKVPERRLGHYAGVETAFPEPFAGTSPTLRAGWNFRTNSASFGGGLRLNYINDAAVRIDFAYARKPNEALSNDLRLFLTVEFGRSYKASWFADKVSKEEKRRDEIADHLLVLSRYPNDYAKASAEALGSVYDTSNVVRYYQLIGGLRLANEYFYRAKERLRNNNVQGAKSQAKKAASAYTTTFNKNIDAFSDAELMNFGEALIMLDKYSMASDTVMIQADTSSLRYHYLMGVCYKYQKRWRQAINAFRQAVKTGQDAKSMRSLSLRGLGESLMASGDYAAAIDTFTIVTTQYYANLAPDYPRYPSYLDDARRHIHNIADDAQFDIGECYLSLGDREKALNSFMKLRRFYLALTQDEQTKIEKIINSILLK